MDTPAWGKAAEAVASASASAAMTEAAEGVRPGVTGVRRPLARGGGQAGVCLTGLEPRPSRLKIDLPLTRKPCLDGGWPS